MSNLAIFNPRRSGPHLLENSYEMFLSMPSIPALLSPQLSNIRNRLLSIYTDSNSNSTSGEEDDNVFQIPSKCWLEVSNRGTGNRPSRHHSEREVASDGSRASAYDGSNWGRLTPSERVSSNEAIVSASQIENSINLFFSVKEDLSRQSGRTEAQIGLEYDIVKQQVAVTMYKIRLSTCPDFKTLYLKTVQLNRGRKVSRTTCWAPRDRAVLDFSKESRFTIAAGTKDTSLLLQVKRSRAFGQKNVVLGETTLGPKTGSETGRAHWAAAMAKPGIKVFMWHCMEKSF